MSAHRLLVVLHDAATRSAVERLFADEGWQVRVAATAREGLALLDAGPEPCCLVLGLDLPDGRGEPILENLRAWGLRTRVAVCSDCRDPARLRSVAELTPDVLVREPRSKAHVWNDVCRVCTPV